MLTIANHILGTGQLSLAKFLFITASDNALSTHHIEEYLQYIFERIDWTRDVHFHTNTTIDTLDYSGTGLNTGSKVVFAAYGPTIRTLCKELPSVFNELNGLKNAKLVMPGVIALEINVGIDVLKQQLSARNEALNGVAQLIVCDDASFVAASLYNYLWVAYTRCNPANDIDGVDDFTEHKHWGCNSALIMDARIKPHHAPPLQKVPAVEQRIDRLFAKGGSLYGKG